MQQTRRSPGWLRSAGRSGGWIARRKAILAAAMPNPRYHEITFRRGDIRSARFASDGQTILYSAAWQGNPVEIFSARPGAAESRSLGLEHTQLLAVSPTGEMAVALNSHRTGTWVNVGTLASAPLAGGAPREFSKTCSGRTGRRTAAIWRSFATWVAGIAWNIPSAKCSTRPEAGSAIPEFLPRAIWSLILTTPCRETIAARSQSWTFLATGKRFPAIGTAFKAWPGPRTGKKSSLPPRKAVWIAICRQWTSREKSDWWHECRGRLCFSTFSATGAC